MNILELPTELIIAIIDNLYFTDIVNLSEVCKLFHDIITQFSWKQICTIKNTYMPRNIHFLNYFFDIPQKTVLMPKIETCITRNGDIKTTCKMCFDICSDAQTDIFYTNLAKIKKISSVIITKVCIDKHIFSILETVECENIIIIDNIDVDKLFGNFIFYLKCKDNLRSLKHNNKHFLKFQEYNTVSHTKIFGNSSRFLSDNSLSSSGYVDFAWNKLLK